MQDQKRACASGADKNRDEVEQALLNFRNQKMVDQKVDILDFWESRKSTMPELYELAQILHAVPMTQISVERLFSAMKFIYSDLRGNLSPALLQDILIVRCNVFEHESKGSEKKRKSNPKKK